MSFFEGEIVVFYKMWLIVFLNLCLVHPVFAKNLGCDAQCSDTKHAQDLETGSKTFLPSKKEYELMIFVSLGMPEQSLRLWAKQAAHLHIPLRIRGFYKDSLEKTTQKSFELFGKDNLAGLLIDPESFENYNLQAVPAVVLALASRKIPETIPPLFEVVYGDTSLEAALELMARKGCREARNFATTLINQLRVRSHASNQN